MKTKSYHDGGRNVGGDVNLYLLNPFSAKACGFQTLSSKNCLSVFDHFVGLALNSLRRRFLSCRKQSIDLPCKSMDWFLYE